jgi:hypothetical protein
VIARADQAKTPVKKHSHPYEGDPHERRKKLIETAYVEHMSDHFRRASEELLYAYQRNKEAARNHQSGAFKAALHHAKLSKHHSFNAHEHLKEALSIAERIDAVQPASSVVRTPFAPSGVQ